jgi:hypothetical protein
MISASFQIAGQIAQAFVGAYLTSSDQTASSVDSYLDQGPVIYGFEAMATTPEDQLPQNRHERRKAAKLARRAKPGPIRWP